MTSTRTPLIVVSYLSEKFTSTDSVNNSVGTSFGSVVEASAAGVVPDESVMPELSVESVDSDGTGVDELLL